MAEKSSQKEPTESLMFFFLFNKINQENILLIPTF